MKTIVLVRHAKSSWENGDLADHERPLNNRGKQDAPKMAAIFSGRNIEPQTIYSSQAVRAFTTAKHFAEVLNYPVHDIMIREEIYSGYEKSVIKIIKKHSDDEDTIMLFGHNPTFTHLATYLTGEYFDNVPTCGVVCIDFDIDSWQEIENENGKLRFFDYPKKFK